MGFNIEFAPSPRYDINMQSKQNKGGRTTAIKLRRAALDNYAANPATCKECGLIIPVKDGEKACIVRKRVFCNKSCAAKFNNRASPKRKISRSVCVVCGHRIRTKQMLAESRFCRPCRAASRLPLKPQTITKCELFSRRSGWQSARSEIRRHAPLVYLKTGRAMLCRCGYSKYVEVCHIRAVADFTGTATVDEINAPTNLVALCPNCHWELDHGLLQLVAEPGVEPGNGVPYESPLVPTSPHR